MRSIDVGIAVLGAGLQGSCIALELARRGRDVLLVERDACALNRASLRNEGKIHLGLIYAAEASGATALAQLQGALLFRHLIAGWIGDAAWARIGVSTPFAYLVASDSLFDAAALSRHYAQVQAHAGAWQRLRPDLDYLGRPLAEVARQAAGRFPPGYAADSLAAAFITEERAIDPADLAREVRRALAGQPRIRLAASTAVERVKREPGGVLLQGQCGGEPFTARAAQVVNATWDGRLHLDAQAGIGLRPGWVHRLKYRVIVRLPAGCGQLPSATMVLGRYGDVVVRPDHSAYLSWYPAGLRGWSHEVQPPAAWEAACTGQAAGAATDDITRAVVSGVAAWFPAAADAEVLQVDAGAIFAYGHSDVDERSSALHTRHRAGLSGDAQWLSVDTGKLTTAAWFAVLAADRLLGETTPGMAPWPRVSEGAAP